MIAGAQRPMLICMILHWLRWLPECVASHGDLWFKETVHWLSRLGVFLACLDIPFGSSLAVLEYSPCFGSCRLCFAMVLELLLHVRSCRAAIIFIRDYDTLYDTLCSDPCPVSGVVGLSVKCCCRAPYMCSLVLQAWLNRAVALEYIKIV